MQRIIRDRAFVDVRRLLRELLLGIDPVTDQSLPGMAEAASPRARAALAMGIEELRDSAVVERWRAAQQTGVQLCWAAAKKPPARVVEMAAVERSGVGWTLQEDRQMAQEYAEGQNLTMMATNHQRSRGAILARLTHLGLRRSG